MTNTEHGGDTRRGGMNQIVVIGGGVVGMSAAYQAARAGASVSVVDRGDDGQATAAGAGIIAPGTSLRDLPAFLPLATPAVRFYPKLIAQLAEDGETETGYEVCGALHVATDAAARARSMCRTRAGSTAGSCATPCAARARSGASRTSMGLAFRASRADGSSGSTWLAAPSPATP